MSFVKSVNMSLFNWLFKNEFNVIMRQYSKVFLLNEHLGAEDKANRSNS